MSSEKNKEQTVIPGAEKKKAPVTGKARSLTTLLLSVLVLVALIVSGAVYFNSMKLSRQLSDLEASLEKLNNNDRLDDIDETLEALRNTNAGLEQDNLTLKEQQLELINSYDAAEQNDGNNSRDWLLDEIEYLLLIANQRLALDQNVDIALAALQSADDRIKSVNDPALLNIRKQITTDINALNSIEPVDIAGLSIYLADIAGRVDKLPVNRILTEKTGQGTDDENLEEDTELSWWRRFGLEVLGTLKEQVKVYPEGEGAVISLLPEQQYYLRQNLRMQLETARLAVMRKETENFHVSVGTSLEWLNTYFDTDDTGIKNIIDSLNRMSQIELRPVVPDISMTLDILRSSKSDMEENTGYGGRPGNTRQ